MIDVCLKMCETEPRQRLISDSLNTNQIVVYTIVCVTRQAFSHILVLK